MGRSLRRTCVLCLAGAIVLASSLVHAQAPRAKITPETEQSAFFAGEEVKLSYRVTSPEPLEATLQWSYAAGARTIARGEAPIDAGGDEPAEVEIPLSLPPVREGVIFGTQLTVGMVDARDQRIAEHVRPVWLFPRDPFVNRREWLEELKITLYDPEGATKQVFDEAEIPYDAPRTSAALEELTEGVAIIGEGVSFKSRRGLAEILGRLATGGVPVLCLAPADGELPFPGAEEQPPVESIELRRNNVIKELDKRLDADFWPPEGQVVRSGLRVTSVRGRVAMEVADSPDAWPWRRVAYAGGDQEIVCGFGLIESWDAGPTPRFLLAKILEQMTDAGSTETPLPPEEN